METLKTADLADLFGITVETLYNRRAEAPQTLPPARCRPGSRKLFWLKTEVDAWILSNARLENASITTPAPAAPAAAEQPHRRRGRPRKIRSTAAMQHEGGAQ